MNGDIDLHRDASADSVTVSVIVSGDVSTRIALRLAVSDDFVGMFYASIYCFSFNMKRIEYCRWLETHAASKHRLHRHRHT